MVSMTTDDSNGAGLVDLIIYLLTLIHSSNLTKSRHDRKQNTKTKKDIFFELSIYIFISLSLEYIIIAFCDLCPRLHCCLNTHTRTIFCKETQLIYAHPHRSIEQSFHNYHPLALIYDPVVCLFVPLIYKFTFELRSATFKILSNLVSSHPHPGTHSQLNSLAC